MKPLVQVQDLRKFYPGKPEIRAVDGVSLEIYPGETLSLVGESGCGKSTTGRLILRLGGAKTGGKVYFDGMDLYDMRPKELRRLRRRLQPVFQDPYSSLSPRLTVAQLMAEGVRTHCIVPQRQTQDYVDTVLQRCGLQPAIKNRFPHEFSGGQRQRIAIARALSLKPDFVVCDEAVSALDVSVQAQIVNLLQDLQQEQNMSYLFISHDLSVVEHLSHRVAVMYLGRIVELAPTRELDAAPAHPYTRELLSAVLPPEPGRPLPEISPGSPGGLPRGCAYHTRCRYAMAGTCDRYIPFLQEISPGHFCACHLHTNHKSQFLEQFQIWNKGPLA